ncbi:hypothetical protein L211DRAFT_811281 [Terfezia boudieri ATCC MYA-4762]|uniref:Dipeptidase n=1 Tax=Terfezia boudieri ATCC MYA-4762 TaxID=1051890 RepID=A0A3N4LGK1_9PEZI|nr:hypothetical protein L211DRAFT_811281 [Terfezia boudieri ATCC MYA-4762]
MADEKKLNLDIEPARLKTGSSHQLQRDTRFRMIKGLKWVALAVFVLFILDSALMRVFMPIHQCPYQNGIQVMRCVLMDMPKNRKYMEAKQNVTEEEAREMLTKGKMRTVIDGHNDLPYMIRQLYGNQIYDKNFDFMHLPYHVDGTRLEKSNVLGTFWSVFVGCPKSDFDENGVEFGDAIYADAVKETFQQVDLVKRLIELNHFMLLKTSSTYDFNSKHENAVECWFRADASQNDIDACLFEEIFSLEHNLYYNEYDGGDWGKVGRRFSFSPHGWLSSMMGAEGLHQIGNSVANLRGLYELGVRYMTLTHGCNNRYADSATALRGARWGGLSAEGREVVREMNRMGMLVDLSHVSADVMREVLGGVSRAPVMFSHSSVFALCPHPRNVPDDVLHLVKKNNGVVMVNFYPLFVSCGPGKIPANATLEMVVDHIEYIGKLIGWEHVGIGSDFDGIDSVPAGLEDVSKYPDLTVELLKRGVKSIDVVKVMGLNILRVWRAVEIVSKEMRHNGVLPMEDKFVKNN